MKQLKRFFVQKKSEFAQQNASMLSDLKAMFSFVDSNTKVDIWHCYDVEGDFTNKEWEDIVNLVLSEPNVDIVMEESFKAIKNAKYFAKQYLPGQYDQRADSAVQCILAVTAKPVKLAYSTFIGIDGDISHEQFNIIKSYLINEVDSNEIGQTKPKSLEKIIKKPEEIKIYKGFFMFNEKELRAFYEEKGFAMSFDDLLHCQNYFKNEQRDPSETELKVIDTYWSDHCRHTTFATHINNVEFEDDFYKPAKIKAYDEYLQTKKKYSPNKAHTLMDIATIGMKEMRARGLLNNLDVSEEINACSIKIPVKYTQNGEIKEEVYLLQFKNETHNHPTEIEPFGGAATCLGGAIRDPLSGRAYVYGSMRITGAADPRESMEQTLKSKLPQRKICREAANGFSSYGNQIGLATGEVREYYHPNFKAKRLELGAVIAAIPEKNVKRLEPQKDDIVIVLGGATGRDGCGGATGSSKAHDIKSVETAGAEVQKGNPPEERKLQRLFRNPEFSSLIKRCNDFGAGGVAVAIGELSAGLDINLDALPKKYEGLNGTELAISESQERMAVVVESCHGKKIIELAEQENVNAVVVAKINDDRILRMYWQNKLILNLKRDFLDTNGVIGKNDAIINSINKANSPFVSRNETGLLNQEEEGFKENYIKFMEDINNSSQKPLCEMFDNTIGRGTVLLPYGGKTQSSKVDGMVFKVPVLDGESKTVSFMSHGYDPYLASWSPFHGAVYSGIMAVSKAVAMGCDYKEIRLSCQEYFERLRNEPKRFGKPLIALLGAYSFQSNMGLASIGGKDSMSGSFEDLDVPPSLISFAAAYGDIDDVVASDWKHIGTKLVYLPVFMDEYNMPNYDKLKNTYDSFRQLNKNKKILSAKSVENSIAVALANACFGNNIGLKLEDDCPSLFVADYGSLIIEMKENDYKEAQDELKAIGARVIATTIKEANIEFKTNIISLEMLKDKWSKALSGIYKYYSPAKEIEKIKFEQCNYKYKNISLGHKPKLIIPVFPGTNCEYDMQKAFEQAGAEVHSFVIKNRSKQDLEYSIAKLAEEIKQSHIFALAGGFSAGDEPEGSGKYISAILRQSSLADAINQHVKIKQGLIIGICNGFQALVKSGLLPYGEIRPLEEDSPSLSFNSIGRHVTKMAYTQVCSINSPWTSNLNLGELHNIAISHGEGRFIASPEWIEKLIKNKQIFTRYTDENANSYDFGEYNPNGSSFAIEGIISEDGRILGKMGHSERYENGLYQNIYGNKFQDIFSAGVKYFK